MTDIKEETLQAALAGLLHDIGKFAQRQEEKPRKHAEVGDEFVKHYVPGQWQGFLYPVIGHHDKPLTGDLNKVVALADRLSAGERTEEKEEQPCQLLSIFCRLQTKIQKDGIQDERKKEFKIQRCSDLAYWPLRELALKREVIFPGEAWPDTKVRKAYQELWQGFCDHAKRLQAAHTPDGRLDVYLESMLLLMQRYTWCVPSAYYRSQPDVSLYDHSRMTAALAALLYKKNMDERVADQLLQALDTWYEARRQAERVKQDVEIISSPQVLEETPIALLVGGDISGVQDFIYTITSQGAASALRGRSFYLQLLTEVLARYVLRELGLPICNLIYQGGGGFYLLARVDDGERLQGIQCQISTHLLRHHRGDLYVALAAVPLKAADFYDGRISGKWEELTRVLRQVKQRRFAEMEQGLVKVFLPQEDGGSEEKECAVCGREHPDTRRYPKRGETEEEGVRKCPPCVSYEELGKDLRQARYLWLRIRDEKASKPTSSQDVPPGNWQDVLAAFGFEAGVASNVPRLGEHLGVVLALDDAAVQQLAPDRNTAVGRRFLVNVTPLITRSDLERYRDQLWEDLRDSEVGDVKPFSLLEAQSRGIHRLGVLRMDLDDGGQLFSDGFVEYDKQSGEVLRRFATLSRVAALSFAISLYFEGWVEFLAQAMNEETRQDANRGDTLYSIYSGGDDLFFVGAWDRVIELARRVRADLTPFAAGHPGVHASAGVVLVGGKYPLYQAARDAGDAEGKAKRYQRQVNGSNGFKEKKDAVHFLGQTVSWARFGLAQPVVEGMETVSGLAQRLARLTRPRETGGAGVPAALLRVLIRAQEHHDVAMQERRKCGADLNRQGEEQVLWGPWMWRTYYMLRRMAERHKDQSGREIKELAEQLKGENFRAIEWVGLAARWVELLSRDVETR
ncbi:MAG: type III-A CRISPR-associated protein Cas10/Csm1 [Anaerolineae bacterium]|nr:type III-A CRISPR-associated protein Cas10/Csm1 [Anaerolineae bacterium]MDW8070982.1 type III-A CRISPR-associated protein Cas10/Csm1 [Anaerolineae bacterium]